MRGGRAQLFIILFACVGASCPVYANLSASPIILHFEATGDNRQDIVLRNESSRNQYLAISAERINKNGTEIKQPNSVVDPTDIGLLVAPRKLSLKPQEERVIRVVRIPADGSVERAWRVNISPVMGNIESNSSVAVVQLGYRALVIETPAQPVHDLLVDRIDQLLTITNEGNTNVLLTEGQQCSDQDQQCDRIAGGRIWPGESWSRMLPADLPVTFSVTSANKRYNATY